MCGYGHKCVLADNLIYFLSYDATPTQSSVMPQYVVRPSVCLSVTFGYRDHIGWNTSKIISQLSSLRYLLRLTPTSAI